ncbi:hypothetical protein Bca4012_089139 [Brassica carinata]
MIVLKNRIRQLIKDWNKKSLRRLSSRSDQTEEKCLISLMMNSPVRTLNPERLTLMRNNPKKKKSARKVMTPSRAYTQTSASSALAEGSVAKSSHLEIEDTWGYLAVVKKGHLEKTVTGLVDFILVLIKEFCAGIPNEISNASKEKVEVLVCQFAFEFSPL